MLPKTWWLSQYWPSPTSTGEDVPSLEFAGKGSFAQPFTQHQDPVTSAGALSLCGPASAQAISCLKVTLPLWQSLQKVSAEGACVSKSHISLKWCRHHVPLLSNSELSLPAAIFVTEMLSWEICHVFRWDFLLSLVDGELYVSNKINQLDWHTLCKGWVTG